MVTGPVPVPFFCEIHRPFFGSRNLVHSVVLCLINSAEFWTSFYCPKFYPYQVNARIHCFYTRGFTCNYYVELSKDVSFLDKLCRIFLVSARTILQTMLLFKEPSFLIILLFIKIIARRQEFYTLSPYIDRRESMGLEIREREFSDPENKLKNLFIQFAQGRDSLFDNPLIKEGNPVSIHKLKIGEETEEYFDDFLKKSAFFQGLIELSSNPEEPIEITHFPYTHEELSHLQNQWKNKKPLSLEETQKFAFLGLTNWISLDDEKALMDGQKTLNSQPSVSELKPSFDLFSNHSLNQNPIEALTTACEYEDESYRYYFCNKIVNEFIENLDQQNFLGEDFLHQITNLLDQCPGAQGCVTTLRLPSRLFHQDPDLFQLPDAASRLNRFLPRFKNLRWLQIDTSNSALLPENLTTEMPSLKVLSIVGNLKTTNKEHGWSKEQLFPNLKILELRH